MGEQDARVTIRRSQTDQTAEGAVVAEPEGRRIKPLVHLRAWLAAVSITDGPIRCGHAACGLRVGMPRLSDHTMARILQARAEAAALKSARYGGHSPRAGFVIAAARAGANV